jgi:hypothetical protein
MRFSIIHKGRIASQGDSIQKLSIRRAIQNQLKALYAVTSKSINVNNKIIIKGVKYTAIIPISWPCSIKVRILRSTPSMGRGGSADLDNLVKTLSDGITAPHGFVGQSPITSISEELFCIALEDNQIASIQIDEDFHWASTPDDDITIITVETKQTDIDDKVLLGGSDYSAFRQGTF